MKRYDYRSVWVYLLIVLCASAGAQVPSPEFKKQNFATGQYQRFSHYKKIPPDIIPQVLVALSYYPQLLDTKIVFRYRKRNTPLSSRPRVWSTFRRKENRTYVITISNKTNKRLTPILFSNLPYNAQIGVLGHELAHISTYSSKTSGQLLGLYLSLLKSKNVDAFELDTDLTCIAQGLGHQLLAWSRYVREELDILEWRGAPKANYRKRDSKEELRYMNPKTIKEQMAKNPIYKSLYFDF